MQKLFIILIGILHFGIGWAQTIPAELDPRNYANGLAYIEDSELLNRGSDLSKFTALDTMNFQVYYLFCNSSSVKHEDSESGEKMRLDIGKSHTAFYSYKLFDADSTYTILIKRGSPRNIWDYSSGFHVYGDMTGRTLETLHRIPFNSGMAIVVNESSIPRWQIDSVSRTILGYHCLRAQTDFHGRKWIAWFAPELPWQVGPWKLWGLPGLILSAKDSRNIFSFECISIVQRMGIIKKFDWRYTPMNQAAWLRYERQMHKDPFAIFGQNTLLISGEHEQVDNSWVSPYIPLELE